MSEPSTNADVIIIGAGVAGLSAASALRAQGVEALVLEAADHIGGRCVTNRTLVSQPFDLGASWLHSAEINPLARVAERMDVTLHKLPWAWHWVYADARVLTNTEVADYNAYQDKMWDGFKQAAGDGQDPCVADALPQSPVAANSAKTGLLRCKGATQTECR